MERAEKTLDNLFAAVDGPRYLKWPVGKVLINSIGSGGTGRQVSGEELSQPSITRPVVIEKTHDALPNGNGHIRAIETPIAAHSVRPPGGDTATQASLDAQRAARFVNNPLRHSG
jgi:hypothetical protein